MVSTMLFLLLFRPFLSKGTQDIQNLSDSNDRIHENQVVRFLPAQG